MRKAAFSLAFCFIVALQTFAQNSSLSFGSNVTWFSDWDTPFNLFNPEIFYSRKVKSNCILVSIDGFYGKSPKGQTLETGDVYDRMIFTLKGNYSWKFKNLLLGLGPAVRYRNERRKRVIIFDYVGRLNEEIFDFGLNGSALYSFNTGKNSMSLKLGYSAFNKGRNPLSLGIFYDWRRKKVTT